MALKSLQGDSDYIPDKIDTKCGSMKIELPAPKGSIASKGSK